jgi:lipopolysaccharide export system permease protein
MNLVQRYIFRQLLWPFVTAIAAFAGLALLTQSLSNIDLISGYSETALTFLKVTVLALPHLTALLLPIALFIATLNALGRLTSDSEIVVTMTSGMTRWGLLAPLVRLALYAIIANLAINLIIQPLSYREMRESVYALRSDIAANLVTPGAFTELGDGVTIYARERTSDGRMRDILIHDEQNASGATTYTAREGVIVRTEERSAMVMIDGNLQQVDETGELNYGVFDRYEFDLAAFVGPIDAIFFKESDRFLHELIWPDSVLRARIDGYERAQAEAHYRLSAPLYLLMFVLIAGATYFAGDYSRMGYGRRVMVASAIGGGLRLLGFSMQSAATDVPELNAMQYLVPIAGVAAAIAYIYWPRRARPTGPAEDGEAVTA